MPYVRRDVVKEYLREFPDTPSLTLARMMYRENPAAFKDVDAARTAIRYFRGSQGASHREAIAERSFLAPTGEFDPFESLPPGLTSFDDWKVYPVPGKRVLVLCDPHVPYHDLPALKTALMFGWTENADTIFLNGDFMDFYSISFWEKDPKQRNFANELAITVEVLTTIRNAFPNSRIVLKLGNHEERYERYMRVKAPELLGVKEFELANLIHAGELGIDIIAEKRTAMIGKLYAVHGHEFGKAITAPVNPARGLYVKGKANAICGHHHQSSNHGEKSRLDDTQMSCWSIGCLSDLHPDYAALNSWNHGFAMVHVEDDGNFQVENKKIISGKIYNA
jgi:predicted phosphodiesterase